MTYNEKFKSAPPAVLPGFDISELETLVEKAIETGRAIIVAEFSGTTATESGYSWGLEGDEFPEGSELTVYKNNDRGSRDN